MKRSVVSSYDAQQKAGTLERNLRIASLWHAGMSCAAIARLLKSEGTGLTRQRVQAIVARYNKNVRKRKDEVKRGGRK